MIYLKLSDDRKLIVLEPENIGRLRAGKPASTPDNAVMVAYTPDAAWVTEELIKLGGKISPDALAELLSESLGRPEVNMRPYHPDLDLLAERKPE
jgi:hypothetical protein